MITTILQISMLTVPVFFALFLTKGSRGNYRIRFQQFWLYFILINLSASYISYIRGVKGISFYNMTYSYCIKWLSIGMVLAVCYSIVVNYIWKYQHHIKMDRITYINLIIYLYLALPTLIFFIGWLKWYWALPFGVLATYACIRGIRDSIRERCLVIFNQSNWKTMLKALLLIILWVYLSGIGGYCFQNDDHWARNTIFRALVERGWPVVSDDGSRMMIYYIGFWLPAACIGKLFGLEAGYTAQYVWAVTGIFIVYYLICVYRKKVDMLPIMFLVLFSGLDYVGKRLLTEGDINLSVAPHIEWWAKDIQFSSMTTQLFWVFNQALPAWLGTMLIMVQKSSRSTLFILSLIMLTSTFPFVGLIPIVIWLYTNYVIKDRQRWQEIFTLQNIVGTTIVCGVSLLYLSNNVSSKAISFINKIGMFSVVKRCLLVGLILIFIWLYGRYMVKDRQQWKEMFTVQNIVGVAVVGGMVFLYLSNNVSAKLLHYLLFYFLEFGVYLYFICKYRKKDPMVWLITCILVICPFVKVGSGSDFCMRASIPALFILMLLCMETFERIYLGRKKYMFAAFCVVLLLGAVTPFTEIHRSIRETFWRDINGESVRRTEVNIEDMLRGRNFSGETQNNFFCQYFAKNNIH